MMIGQMKYWEISLAGKHIIGRAQSTPVFSISHHPSLNSATSQQQQQQQQQPLSATIELIKNNRKIRIDNIEN
jgi:hypothetical protein